MKEIFDYPIFEILSESLYTSPKESRNWDFFEYHEDIYSIMKSEYSYHLEFQGHWQTNESKFNQNLRNWRATIYALTHSKDTPLLPLNFLVFSQKLEGFIPEVFNYYALAVLRWFDVEKYKIAYDLSQDEYDEICHDLEKVLPMLENYPKKVLLSTEILK